MFEVEGASRAYAVSPAFLGATAEKYPGATALVVMLGAWRPYKTVKNGKTATICAYYPAENALYHAAGRLCDQLTAKGFFAKRLTAGDIPVRRVIEDAGIAAIGENGLAATRSLGSYFAVQLVITDAFAPADFEKEPAACIHCGRCKAACPSKALPMTDPQKCIRWWMDGQEMPDWAMNGMRRLFGCELCQLACPRNAHLPPVEMPKKLFPALDYERLLTMDKAERAELSALVGKNLLSRGRARAQALVLADREGIPLRQAAASLLTDERPAVRSAAKYVLSKRVLTDAPPKS